MTGESVFCRSCESVQDAITHRCGPVIGKRQAGESVVHSAAVIAALAGPGRG